MTKGSYRVCILIRSGNGGDICDSHSRNLRIGDVTDAVSGGSDKRFVLRARGGDRLIDGRTGRWNNGPFGAGRRRRGLAETRQPFKFSSNSLFLVMKSVAFGEPVKIGVLNLWLTSHSNLTLELLLSQGVPRMTVSSHLRGAEAIIFGIAQPYATSDGNCIANAPYHASRCILTSLHFCRPR
jgi:hypothetical protein